MFSYLLIRPHQKFIFSMFSTLYLIISTKLIQRNTDTYYSNIIEMAAFPEPVYENFTSFTLSSP